MNPDIICIQEIANQDRVATFLATEKHFKSCAFQDSADGQDNAIFVDGLIDINDIPVLIRMVSNILPRQLTLHIWDSML